MLCVKDVGVDLPDFTLSNVSFDVEDGDYFVLLGASGVGKTVLLELLAGLILPDTGRILWNGEDITRERIQHRQMGLVYQDQALFPHMTVRQNIAFGLRPKKIDSAAIEKRVSDLAETVSIKELLHRYPGTLSGGESQRVALARTLATEPRCLLLDEPLSSLDTQSRTDLQALLRSLHHEGHTIIHVTHEYKEAMALASRVAIMEQKTVTQVGTPDEVFHHPRSEFVARFIGIRNCFSGCLDVSGDGASYDGDCVMSRFVTGGMTFLLLTEASSGVGYLAFRSEDIKVSLSREDSRSQNCFKGTVIDIAPARLGSELTIDIGVEVTALVSRESMERLEVARGKEVWVSLDSSDMQYIAK